MCQVELSSLFVTKPYCIGGLAVWPSHLTHLSDKWITARFYLDSHLSRREMFLAICHDLEHFSNIIYKTVILLF